MRERLRPERAEDLRTVWPTVITNPDRLSHLRVTDVCRLEAGSPEAWAAWRRTASDIVTFSAEDISATRVVFPIKPEEVRFCDRISDWLDDDLTWYAGRRL
ncbi:hypothetical protein [Streptomyces triculaminicus]|uniref:hypothetical protein n=1 Tax=Streptomyces triculaminicus TaxID=2816232 RepID=UPI0037CDD0D9